MSSFYPNFHEYCLWSLRAVALTTPWAVGLVINIRRVGMFRVVSINGLNEQQETFVPESFTMVYVYRGSNVVVDPMDTNGVYQITLQRYDSQKLGGGRSRLAKPSTTDTSNTTATTDTTDTTDTTATANIFKSADGDAPSIEDDNVAEIDPLWYEKWEN